MKKANTNVIQIKEEEDQNQILLQDALNNSNLDETNKKLKQMIRNRISAQNSRDRKKSYVTDLQNNNQYLIMQNTQLLNEIKALKEVNKLLNNEKEELKKALDKGNSFCSHCGYFGLPPNSTDEHINIPTLNIDQTEFDYTRDNGLHSPRLSRLFGGSSKSFLSYMLTIATILSLVLVMNTTNSTESKDIIPTKFYIASENTNTLGSFQIIDLIKLNL